MLGAFQIMKVRGIPLRVHWTLLVLLPYFALKLSRAMGADSDGWGWVAALALFASVALHELGHALVAIRRGYGVHDILLTPIGGVAQLDNRPMRPADELWIAIAGPLVSLALAGLLWWGDGFLYAAGWTPAGHVATLIGTTNLALFLFNLLPCFPMDGGRVLRAALARRRGRWEATRRAVKLSGWLSLALGLYGLWHWDLFLVAIAFFVYTAARAELRLVQLQERPQANPFEAIFRMYTMGGSMGGPPGGPLPRPPGRVQDVEVEVSPPPYRK